MTNSIFQFLKSLVKPHKRIMSFGILCLILVNIFLLLRPYLFSQIIDSIVDDVDTNTSFSFFSSSIRYSLLLCVLSIAIFFLRLGWRRLLILPSYKIETNLKKQLFRHFLRFCQKTQQNFHTGKQVSLIERETEQLTDAISWGTLALIDGLFTVISVYCILIIFYADIAWASMLVYPFSLLYVYIIFRKLGKEYISIQERKSKISELTREMYENIASIKSHNSEAFYKQKFYQKGQGIVQSQVRISFLISMLWPLLILINGIALVLALYFGIKAYMAGTASLGDIFAVLTYIAQVELPFLGLGFAFDTQQKGFSNVRRIKHSLEIQPSIFNKKKELHTKITGALSLKNLVFSYKELETEDQNIRIASQNRIAKKANTVEEQKYKTQEKKFSLGPINLDIAAGTWLGITGKIGSGKSTLAKLISRIYEIQDDRSILWDGQSIQDLNLEQLRSNILYQAQDFHLFSLSVLQNIVFKEKTLTKQERDQAKRYGTFSALEQDVNILPKHWDTQIGEHGILLSGGQKQRVSLARTLFENTPVLVLDDIFSGLDNKTSKEVMKNLLDLRRDKSTIIVSINLPIISNTDRILLLDEGTIAEDGTHSELINNKNSRYSQYWKEYLVNQGEYYE